MPEVPASLLGKVLVGDCRELARLIPDNSVDLVFTDPPWEDDALGLYVWLAQESRRVLRPGGFVLAYFGNIRRPQIYEAFETSGLTYFWEFAGVQMNSDSRLHARKMLVHWRPALVYSQGPAVPPGWLPDAEYTNRDKTYHPWGQGEKAIMRWIVNLSKPGAVVWEPFGGGGTTPAVAKKTGRNHITFELDPSQAKVIQTRLDSVGELLVVTEMTQPRLFNPKGWFDLSSKESNHSRETK